MSEEMRSSEAREMPKIQLSKLICAPYNPRRITDDALSRLKASIHNHSETLPGWNKADGYRLVDPIIVNQCNMRVVGGHQRIKALQELGQDWVHEADVRYVKIENEHKEMALNIMLNNQKAAGEWDYPILKDLIVEIDTGKLDLSQMTGFNQSELDTMFGDTAADPLAEWNGMPEFQQDDIESFRKIIVHFEDASQVEKFSELIGQKFTDKTKSIWFPEKKRIDAESQRYE